MQPDGSFEIDGAVQNFSDLTYSEYYKLFQLQSYDPTKVHGQPHYFLERAPPPNTPTMQVILRHHNNPHITRLQPIRLSLGDVFYLRVLLQIQPVRSFEELRTVDGVLYPSFQEACTALNLFSDGTEAEYCFTEATNSLHTPYQMRLLFIHMLTNECIITPVAIWEKFQEPLSKDFYFSNGCDWNLAFSSTLSQIATHLQEYGKEPKDYGLPQPNNMGNEVVAEILRWASDIPQLLSEAEEALLLFNSEQRIIFEAVWNAVEQNLPLCLFIDGKASRGKTYLVNALCSQVRGHKKIVLATASSAFAAQLYPGG